MIILETIPIFAKPLNYLPGILWGVVFFGITALIIKIGNVETNAVCGILAIIAAILSLAGLLGGIIGTILEPEQDTGRIKYIVKLDDTITMNEFYNKYKIIDHTKYTDIYTVEELKND